jgi:ATP-dependent DNA helicase RecQ
MTNKEILEKYWGHKEFRPVQEDIINAVLAGKDTLALLPTGGGKSICFQVPALAQEGICIVVSPLIALMKDQVENLTQRGIRAIAVTSAMHKREIDIALDNCVYGKIKFLYVSPERLSTEIFKARVLKMNVNLIAVDEAHCISQWGYDFRPGYLKIAELRELLPKVPVLALTATATREVVKDIQQKLGFKKENVFLKSFERKNISYVVLKDEDKLRRLVRICTNLRGSGIVYVRNRKKTYEVSEYLRSHSISADFYHAGLQAAVRDEKQQNWINNVNRVIVCTNAFGMGIDKPDVRFVVHIDLPDCIESYFQEAGRAGRDEKKSFAVLLYNENDRIELEHNVKSMFPSIEEIKQAYQALANYYQLAIGSGFGQSFEFDISAFCEQYALKPIMVYNALKFLEKENYVSVTESLFQPSRIHITSSKEDLYKFQVANPKYDEFIKLILRSYTGTFDSYVKISENDLARRSKLSRENVVKLLDYFARLKLLSYYPQTELPMVMFTRERADAKEVRISKENYEERKQKALKRMDWMLHYAESTDKCRSRLLLSYFGETETVNCGHCDVCLEEKKSVFTYEEFEAIMAEVVSLLSVHPLTLKELITAVADHREEKTVKVVQWLMDNEEVHYDQSAKLCLKH